MRHLKSLALAAAIAAVGSQAIAGGFAPVTVDPEPVVVVEPEAPRSTFGILLPLLLLGGLVAIAVASDDDDDEECVDDTTTTENECD
jgi:hypothetical protein